MANLLSAVGVSVSKNSHEGCHLDDEDGGRQSTRQKEKSCFSPFGLRPALMNAVKSVGIRIDKIKDFLGAGGAGKQSGG